MLVKCKIFTAKKAWDFAFWAIAARDMTGKGARAHVPHMAQHVVWSEYGRAEGSFFAGGGGQALCTQGSSV